MNLAVPASASLSSLHHEYDVVASPSTDLPVKDSRLSERHCAVPLRDRVVDIIAACRLGFNAVCMALLVVAGAEGVHAHAERLETAVGVMEVLFLLLGRNLQTLFGVIRTFDHYHICFSVTCKEVVQEGVVGAFSLLCASTPCSTFCRLALDSAIRKPTPPPYPN